MTGRKLAPAKPATAGGGRGEVDAFMKDFGHPKKAEMEALRAIIRVRQWIADLP